MQYFMQCYLYYTIIDCAHNIICIDIFVSLLNLQGGPFGVEPSLRAAGNLYAIIGFAAMPFLWALPEAVMTYELSTLYPCSSGGVRWVRIVLFMFEVNGFTVYADVPSNPNVFNRIVY